MSMNIAVEVRSGDIKGGELSKTTECLIVFVPVDEDGKSMPVDTFMPETPGEIALANMARTYLDNAKSQRSGS